ncbi:MAG: DNA primase, partial [Eubacterium sp.]|nr:DNA primase [Eubacterium sp.]
KRGNTSVGLCPFHNEKTPSFTVYNDTQSYYCFGCGAGGGAINFIMRIENLDFTDAVKFLADRAGLQMPQDGFDDSLAKRRRNILAINRETAKFYYNYMMSPEGKVGLDYFLNRGLRPGTIKRFGLGYAPDAWDELLKYLKNKGFSVSDMVAANVVKISKNNHYYDTFKNRVITPIIDVRGNVIAFGGRVLDDSKPKYINTADTLVYKKTNELFAMNLAKESKADNLILCEGYMDVIAMHEAGFTNAVAGCGTALTSEQVRLISRYTNEVILAYDADEAGQKAIDKAVRLFSQTDVKIRIPVLTGGKDPDEIIRNLGRDRFKGMLDGASNEVEFALLGLKSKYNTNSTQGKIDYLNDAVKILAGTSPIEQDIYLTRLSEELEVSKQSIKAQLDSYSKRYSRRKEKAEYKRIVDESVRNNNKQAYDENISLRQIKAEERIIGLLLKNPDYIKALDGFDSALLSSPFIKKVYDISVSRIKNGLELDLNDFSQVLTAQEIGRLSGIIARTPKEKDKDP